MRGYKTCRVYALLDKVKAFGAMASYLQVMQLVGDEAGEAALLSTLLAINLMLGETDRQRHFYDSYINLEISRPPFSTSAFRTFTNTNKEDGATEVIPRSHIWKKA